MPRHYPPEVRREACERMLAGETIKDLVHELGITIETLYRWRPARSTPSGQALRWIHLPYKDAAVALQELARVARARALVSVSIKVDGVTA